MPKKQFKKNPFMFFVSHFQDEQKKKGIKYNHINQAIAAADPVWRELSKSEKAKYESMFQKQNKGQQVEKYTSTGIPISVIENAEREIRESEELVKKDVVNLVNSRVISNTLITMDMYVMDVNSYCKVGQNYIIGEFTLLRFNVKDGVKEIYHEVINPGRPPEGYAYEMKMGAVELGLDMPDYEEPAPKTNYMQLLANIIDYLKLQDRNSNVLPPVFTLTEKVQHVSNFIWQLCQRAGEDETLFRVYQMDLMMHTLLKGLGVETDESVSRECMTCVYLRNDNFRYSTLIACERHETRALSPLCTQSRARRVAYSVLDMALPATGVTPLPGRHVPPDHYLPAIMALRERRADDARVATAARVTTPPDDGVDRAARGFASLYVSRVEPVHVPQRMPKADYSRRIRVAPELTEEDFPALPARSHTPGVSNARGAHSTRGVPRGGRGRGMRADRAH